MLFVSIECTHNQFFWSSMSDLRGPKPQYIERVHCTFRYCLKERHSMANLVLISSKHTYHCVTRMTPLCLL